MASERAIKKLMDDIKRKLENAPWTILFIGADRATDEPSFAYSVGASRAPGLPELLVFSLPPATAADAIDTALKALKARLDAGQPVTGKLQLEGFPTEWYALPTIAGLGSQYAKICHMTETTDAPTQVTQLIWPDTAGLFPWEAGFDTRFSAHQPILYLPPASSNSKGQG